MTRATCLLIATALGLGCWGVAAADAGAAERQYRLARRLAAEGSAQAAEAFRKVVELDPEGPLADDAIVEESLLDGVPTWPSETGRLTPRVVARTRALLGRVADGMPAADRAPEAAYRRALLRLEPHDGQDAAAARIELLAVASNPAAGEWAPAARFAIGHLAAATGDVGRARDAWFRVVVDAPGGPAAARAAAGLGRLALRAERPEDAAQWFESARASGHDVEVESRGIELAVRRLLGANATRGPAASVVPLEALRGSAAVAVAPDGGLALVDRRAGGVVRLAAGGREIGRFPLDDVQALAFDPTGGLVAAAGDRVWRLPRDGVPTPLGGQGDFAPASALAAGPLGTVWLLDRRGERIGRLGPGQEAPTAVWNERGMRLAGLAWDGRRLVSTAPKTDLVIAIDVHGNGPAGVTPLAVAFVRIGPVAADPSGRIAAVDNRAGVTILMDASGVEVGRVDLASIGVERPTAIGFDDGGRLHFWDDADSTWVVLP